jgi:hypothetical protein
VAVWRYSAPRYAPNRLHLFAVPEAVGGHQGRRADFFAEFQALPALVSGKAEPREEKPPAKPAFVKTEPWTVGPATIDT